MELALAIVLIVIALLLFLATRTGLVKNETLQTWANIAGIASFLGGIIVIVASYLPQIFSCTSNSLAEADGIIWQATFYGNKELKEPITCSGNVKGARNGLRVDWGNETPGAQTPRDFFSATFATTHNFLADVYCFVIEVDDGARLFVDGVEIRNVWWGHTPGAVYKTRLSLQQGPHDIQFYYYEEFEKASFHLYWYPNAGPECVTTGHPGVP
jgi:hypothetical protein